MGNGLHYKHYSTKKINDRPDMNITIKTTYLIIGAALMFSACSQDDDNPGRTDGESRQILFRASLPSLDSRSEALTKESLDYFQVTAFDPADPEKVEDGVLQPNFNDEKIEISKYNASPNCIWPDPGYEAHLVTFYGFYPSRDVTGAGEFNNSTPATLDYGLSGITIEREIADQYDFVTAYTTGTMADNLFSGVTLPFLHQLCRVEVRAYSDHKSCDIEIAGVRIGGIYKKANFNFKPEESTGYWSDFSEKDYFEYIFGAEDKIVELKKGSATTSTKAGAVSIMGNTKPNDNNAMLLPAEYSTEWDYANDKNNGGKGMYISVLLRIIDATRTAGIKPEDPQRYPYRDLAQGADALDIPKVYFAVDKTTGIIANRLFKNGEDYFTDKDFSNLYAIQENEEIREFGWAALPVKGNWEPGKIYTYTLDYTVGVGLHDPEVTTASPKAGDPIISDKVTWGIDFTVSDWRPGTGDKFEVPGS